MGNHTPEKRKEEKKKKRKKVALILYTKNSVISYSNRCKQQSKWISCQGSNLGTPPLPSRNRLYKKKSCILKYAVVLIITQNDTYTHFTFCAVSFLALCKIVQKYRYRVQMNGINSFHKNKNKTVQIKHQNWNTKEQT